MYVFRISMFNPYIDGLKLESTLDSFAFLLLTINVVIVAVSGYWINDYYDKDIDLINRPERLLVKYKITENRFWMLYSVLIFIGLLFTLYIGNSTSNLKYTWLYPFSIALLYLYARCLKRMGWVGNLLISILIASIPWLLFLAEWNAIIISKKNFIREYNLFLFTIFKISFLMFCSNISREIIKDIEDIEGDRKGDSKSIPLIFGVNYSKVVVTVFLGLIIFIESMSFYFKSQIISSSLIVIFCLLIIYKSSVAREKKHYKLLSLAMKLVMIFGLVQLTLRW